MAKDFKLPQIDARPELHRNEVKKEEDKNSTKEVDFDDLVLSAGEFGRAQLIMFLITFPFYTFGAYSYFGQLFMTEVPSNYWCWIPELANLTDIERRSLAIPSDVNTRFGYSFCRAYDANWTEVLRSGIQPDATWKTTPCQHGWEFNKTDMPYSTISMEMEWVCDKGSNQANAQAIFFLGSIVGGVIIGYVSDHFGRLPAAIVSNVIGCVGGVASIFARDFTEFAICRFVIGMCYDNCFMMVYLIVLEYCAPKYRSLMANLSFGLFYSLALTTLPWISLACGHWTTISLATSLPQALAIFSPLLIPESPRWLLSKGRDEEAVKKLTKFAKTNSKVIPPKLIERFLYSRKFNSKKEEKGSVVDLMRRPSIRKMFLCICLIYMFCNIVFDGLVRSIGTLDFDFFVSFTVISFTEFPSLVLVAFILDIFGRRWLCATVMTVSCIFSILSVFVGGGLSSVMCAVVARFCVNMAFNTCIQWAAEILPVSVRGIGVSIVHICGYFAAILSPYIVYLEIYVTWLPLVIIGCVAGATAILALFLPETAKKDLPQTFEDTEEMQRNQKFFDLPCLRKKTETVSGHTNDTFAM